MGLVIIASNYLVQFQVNHYNLQDLLTYGAFSYPVTLLITDLANRAFGKAEARKIVYLGFVIGIFLTLVLSTNIPIRRAKVPNNGNKYLVSGPF